MKRACLLGGTLFFAKSAEIGKKMLDKSAYPLYNLKAVKNAAIAQSVERILGKDEVASSNLASSSKVQDQLVLDFLYISKSLSTASRRMSLRTSAAALVWQSVNLGSI